MNGEMRGLTLGLSGLTLGGIEGLFEGCGEELFEESGGGLFEACGEGGEGLFEEPGEGIFQACGEGGGGLFKCSGEELFEEPGEGLFKAHAERLSMAFKGLGEGLLGEPKGHGEGLSRAFEESGEEFLKCCCGEVLERPFKRPGEGLFEREGDKGVGELEFEAEQDRLLLVRSPSSICLASPTANTLVELDLVAAGLSLLPEEPLGE